MSAALISPTGSGEAGRWAWGMSRSEDGHKDYWVIHRVRTTDSEDGPNVVFNTPGLPLIGSPWTYGNDINSFALAKPRVDVSQFKAKDGEPSQDWSVKSFFSTRPGTRCQDEDVEDPLLEPQDVSGNFSRFTSLARTDKDGNLLTSSSHEFFTGSDAEFDDNRPTVRIGQNVASLGLNQFASFVNTVNDAPLWGVVARGVKLADVAWSRLYQGSCDEYYRRNFVFEINTDTFDRTTKDKGKKVLDPDANDGAPDKNNPKHFKLAVDEVGNPKGEVLLDGNGEEVAAEANVADKELVHYPESNFLLLGIPTTL